MTVKEAAHPVVTGERICKIASSYGYVDCDVPVYELLADIAEPGQRPIAVVGPAMEVLGVIHPRELVEILGKPFGRDLLMRQKVQDIMRDAVTFRYDEYIQEIRDRISGDLEGGVEAQYVLVDENAAFSGHVSSRDILVHAMEEHRRELKTAQSIQGRLVPPCLTVRGKLLSVVCSSVMAQGVGGDYYYARQFAQGKWFLCLCDISGKGVSAAIITAVLAGFLHSADLSLSLEETIRNLNDLILDTFQLNKYLTGFFCVFDELSGELRYCDMGHSFFFAVEGTRMFQVSEQADNVPVGLVADVTPVERVLRLSPGTTFAVVSDGFVEQENRNSDSYPLDRLGAAIATCENGDLLRAKVKIFEDFFTFKKDAPQRDDISLLLFRYDQR